jgi:hypothetical protein
MKNNEEKDYTWWVLGAMILFALLLKACPTLNHLICSTW